MRTILLSVCVLILLSGEAFAAKTKRFAVTGCVQRVGACLIVRSGQSDYFLLGRRPPRATVGKMVRVKGSVQFRAEYLCPTRLIIAGNITVKSWKVTSRSCRSF